MLHLHLISALVLGVGPSARGLRQAVTSAPAAFSASSSEKKLLNHFLPGSSVLSFGTAGGNLACRFCQNWDISKSKDFDTLAGFGDSVSDTASAPPRGFVQRQAATLMASAVSVARRRTPHPLAAVPLWRQLGTLGAWAASERR